LRPEAQLTRRIALPDGPLILVDNEGQAPVAAIYLWFGVGAVDETRGMEGAAHLMEHMLFKGAVDRGVGGSAKAIEELGGDLNAFTSHEQTVLHATLPAAGAADAIGILADMGLRPRLDADELELERKVVVEEIRGAADDPSDRLSEAIRAVAFAGHPYGRPVLGTAESVNGMTAAQLRGFHTEWYRPGNAFLCVAGPVDVDAVVAAATRHIGPAQHKRLPRQLVPATGPRAASALAFDLDFTERLVELAFPVPGTHGDDAAALDVLAMGLGGGDAALLPAKLQHGQDLALGVWAHLELDRQGGLLVAGLSAKEGSTAPAITGLARILVDVADEGLPSELVRRAKAAILASRLTDRETVDGRAFRTGWYQDLFGDPTAELRYEEAVRAVTPAAVRAAARRWLDLGVCTAGLVAPREDLDQAGLKRALQAGRKRKQTRAPVAVGPRRALLTRGSTLLVEPDERSEMVAISLVGIGGQTHEEIPGLAAGWAGAVQRGAGGRDLVELSSAAEERCGSLRAWTGRSSSGMSALFPADELSSAVELLADLLLEPEFDPEEVARTRDELDEARDAAADDPLGLGMDAAWALLFPGHAWARPSHGTAAGVRRVRPRALRAFHGRTMVGRNLVFAVTGAVDPAEVQRRLERALRRLPEGVALQPDAPTAILGPVRERRIALPRLQAHVVLAFPGSGQGQPESAPDQVIQAVLGGQGGRLFLELREALGLAYSVSAGAEPGLGLGAFVCHLSTDPGRVDEALAALRASLLRLRSAGVDSDELARVRASLAGAQAVGLQRASSRAAYLAAAERYVGGGEKYRDMLARPLSVTAEQMQTRAATLLDLDRSVCVRVEPR
jgi:zinc protease